MTAPTTLRDLGTSQALAAADPRVLLMIDAEVKRLCESGAVWSVNDCRHNLPACDPHVIGARILTLSKRRNPRLMRPVGFEPSELASTRGAQIRLWVGVE